jgi:hypothetical protein
LGGGQQALGLGALVARSGQGEQARALRLGPTVAAVEEVLHRLFQQ